MALFKRISEEDFNKYQKVLLDAIQKDNLRGYFTNLYGYTVDSDLYNKFNTIDNSNFVKINFVIYGNLFSIVLNAADSNGTPIQMQGEEFTYFVLLPPNPMLPKFSSLPALGEPLIITYDETLKLTGNWERDSRNNPLSQYFNDAGQLQSYFFKKSDFCTTLSTPSKPLLGVNLYFTIHSYTQANGASLFGVVVEWIFDKDNAKMNIYSDLVDPCPPCCPCP